MYIGVGNVPAPEPVCFPYQDHLFDRYVLRFGQEERYKRGHDEHPTAEKVEQPELKVAQHCQKRLRDYEGEEHVNRHVYALPGRPNFEWEDFTGHQPPERAPRPCESCHIQADESHEEAGMCLAEGALAARSQFYCDQCPDNNLNY